MEIARATLDQFFRDSAARGANLASKPMLWGFFFVDRERKRLDAAASMFPQIGLRFVAILGTPGDYRLHGEEVATHTTIASARAAMR